MFFDAPEISFFAPTAVFFQKVPILAGFKFRKRRTKKQYNCRPTLRFCFRYWSAAIAVEIEGGADFLACGGAVKFYSADG